MLRQADPLSLLGEISRGIARTKRWFVGNIFSLAGERGAALNSLPRFLCLFDTQLLNREAFLSSPCPVPLCVQPGLCPSPDAGERTD